MASGAAVVYFHEEDRLSVVALSSIIRKDASSLPEVGSIYSVKWTPKKNFPAIVLDVASGDIMESKKELEAHLGEVLKREAWLVEGKKKAALLTASSVSVPGGAVPGVLGAGITVSGVPVPAVVTDAAEDTVAQNQDGEKTSGEEIFSSKKRRYEELQLEVDKMKKKMEKKDKKMEAIKTELARQQLEWTEKLATLTDLVDKHQTRIDSLEEFVANEDKLDKSYEELSKRVDQLRSPGNVAASNAISVIEQTGLSDEEKAKALLADASPAKNWKLCVYPAMKTAFPKAILLSSCPVSSDKSETKRPALDGEKLRLLRVFVRAFAKSSKCTEKPAKELTDADINVQFARVCNQTRRPRPAKMSAHASSISVTQPSTP